MWSKNRIKKIYLVFGHIPPYPSRLGRKRVGKRMMWDEEFASIKISPNNPESPFWRGETFFEDKEEACRWARKLRYHIKKKKLGNSCFSHIDYVTVVGYDLKLKEELGTTK